MRDKGCKICTPPSPGQIGLKALLTGLFICKKTILRVLIENSNPKCQVLSGAHFLELLVTPEQVSFHGVQGTSSKPGKRLESVYSA